MLFKLRTTMTFDRTVECSSRAEAIELAKQKEAEAQSHNHHGEVTTVDVLTFLDHVLECEQCAKAKDNPCETGKVLLDGEDDPRQDSGPLPAVITNFLVDGLNGMLMRLGMRHGQQATAARDERSCPKCGAEIGHWCKSDDGRVMVHRERLGEAVSNSAGPHSAGCLDCGALTEDDRTAPLVHKDGCPSGRVVH